jgi:hypothetical protein
MMLKKPFLNCFTIFFGKNLVEQKEITIFAPEYAILAVHITNRA